MAASLLTQINMEGGSNDKDTTDEAVIACLTFWYCEDTMLTADVTSLMELRNSFFKSELFISCAR